MNTLILPALNLLILIGFIVYKTKLPFYQFMQKRRDDVYEGLNRSKVQAKDAALKKSEIEAKFKSLEQIKATIRAEWKQRESQQIAALRDSSERIILQMGKEGEQNKRALEQALQRDILREFKQKILLQAETKIKQNLSPEIHLNLNENFIKEVQQNGVLEFKRGESLT